ncbi:MAG: RsmD family RNA methyltransferase [Planctomycetes bacterium]|nr:RsmD family RNA methyltransferase [Planctomycetota bacterium]
MLRISGGERLKNRKLAVPETGEIRPMIERTRMALFSIIGQDFAKDANVLDAFAGSGLLGFEAISRGAGHCSFFDLRREHLDSIRQHANAWGVSELVRTEARDVMKTIVAGSRFRFPDGKDARLVFLDPPHALSDDRDSSYYYWMERLDEAPTFGPETLIVFGHHARLDLDDELGGLRKLDHRKYGKVAISMWELRT